MLSSESTSIMVKLITLPQVLLVVCITRLLPNLDLDGENFVLGNRFDVVVYRGLLRHNYRRKPRDKLEIPVRSDMIC